jgi:hypothetical protein
MRSIAREVDASCWSPRLKISDREYREMVTTKARELVRVLLQTHGIVPDAVAPPPAAQAPPVRVVQLHRAPTPPFGESARIPGAADDDEDDPFKALPTREFEKSEAFWFYR